MRPEPVEIPQEKAQTRFEVSYTSLKATGVTGLTYERHEFTVWNEGKTKRENTAKIRRPSISLSTAYRDDRNV